MERLADGLLPDENLMSLRNENCFQDKELKCEDQNKLKAHWPLFPRLFTKRRRHQALRDP